MMRSCGFTSPRISELWGFQRIVRLSFPHESRRSGSCLHHETESTPLSCPERIWKGQSAISSSSAR